MKITPDTNVLIRAVVRDDIKQARVASKLLKEAELIAISLASLCEFVWVLRRVYNFGLSDISSAIEVLLNAGNVTVNRPAVDAGLAMLNAGGDFADGLIAYEGSWLGVKSSRPSTKKPSPYLNGKAIMPDCSPDNRFVRPCFCSKLWNRTCPQHYVQMRYAPPCQIWFSGIELN